NGNHHYYYYPDFHLRRHHFHHQNCSSLSGAFYTACCKSPYLQGLRKAYIVTHQPSSHNPLRGSTHALLNPSPHRTTCYHGQAPENEPSYPILHCGKFLFVCQQ